MTPQQKVKRGGGSGGQHRGQHSDAPKGGGFHFAQDIFLGHAHICDLDVAIRIQHHVVKLQIAADRGTHNMRWGYRKPAKCAISGPATRDDKPIDDASLMHEPEAQENLGGVEHGVGIAEFALGLHTVQRLPHGAKRRQKGQTGRRHLPGYGTSCRRQRQTP
jgi:hypothetical protein